MGLLDKFVSGIKSQQQYDDANEDYFLDDDYQDDDYVDDYQDEDEYVAPKRKLFGRSGNDDNSNSGGLFGRKVINGAPQGAQVTMVRPNSLDDSRTICDFLLDGKAVVLNMEGMNTETAQRIIDFTLGAVYSIGGDLQMISKYIFIASPQNVELSGDFQGNFANMNASQTTSYQKTQNVRSNESRAFSFN